MEYLRGRKPGKPYFAFVFHYASHGAYQYLPGHALYSTADVTSHLDIVPTLLPLLGVKNPASDYSSGRGLFDMTPRPFVPVFSWDTAAIIRNGEVLEMPLKAYNGGGRQRTPERGQESRGGLLAPDPGLPERGE